ncbi:hypothetical protein [Methylobacterium symbioticum]|nr:hypothetical protein [Methylobacterium symbioticum]
MTLAVRSINMEHYRSTFAVTGIAVLGLLAAAGILHPGHFERSGRPATRPAVSAAATAWVDPPTSRPVAQRRSSALPDVAALMKAEPTAVLAPDGVMVQLVPADLTLVAATPGRTEAGHGRKVVRRTVATRHVAATRQVALNPQSTAGSESDSQPSEPASTQGKIDPIGDLIRGLGLGNNS